MRHRCPECGTPLPAGVPAWARQLSVGQAMTADPLTLGPDDSMARALEVMRSHDIRRLPVVEEGGLVGLLTDGDMKRYQPSALSESHDDFVRVMDSTPVSRIMINDPVTVTEATPLVDAAATLRSTKFGALPVVRDGVVVGILTDSDVIGSLVELLRHGG